MRVEEGGSTEEAGAGREGEEVVGPSGNARPVNPSIWKGELYMKSSGTKMYGYLFMMRSLAALHAVM